jgi:hypothetical protein
MRSHGRPKEAKAKEQKMKSLEFSKRTLASTLAIVLAGMLSVRTAQAGYTVMLQQVGPDVVATGSGAINLHGLTFYQSGSQDPAISPSGGFASIYTGPTSSSVDLYGSPSGPTNFGMSIGRSASSGSGDMVGITAGYYVREYLSLLSVPTGYISGTTLSDTAIYSGTTLASLGVTPGTYVWTWGTTANQNFTLQIPPFPQPPPPATNITNISTRGQVLTGDNILDGGFIITGTESKDILIRGIGPSLSSPGLSGVLADPTLELHLPDGSVVSNDNWKDTQEQEIMDTTIPPTNNLESAILVNLQPGAYTVILAGKGGGTGIGLVEVYDLDQLQLDSMLANISTRGSVGTGDDVLIGGFILQPDGGASSTILVRAIGPSLANANPPVPGALADPTLELHDGNGMLLISNDDWKESQQTEIEATGLAPSDDHESAILSMLAPGAYTVILRGALDTTGVGLVEVYRLP